MSYERMMMMGGPPRGIDWSLHTAANNSECTLVSSTITASNTTATFNALAITEGGPGTHVLWRFDENYAITANFVNESADGFLPVSEHNLFTMVDAGSFNKFLSATLVDGEDGKWILVYHDSYPTARVVSWDGIEWTLGTELTLAVASATNHRSAIAPWGNGEYFVSAYTNIWSGPYILSISGTTLTKETWSGTLSNHNERAFFLVLEDGVIASCDFTSTQIFLRVNTYDGTTGSTTTKQVSAPHNTNYSNCTIDDVHLAYNKRDGVFLVVCSFNYDNTTKLMSFSVSWDGSTFGTEQRTNALYTGAANNPNNIYQYGSPRVTYLNGDLWALTCGDNLDTPRGQINNIIKASATSAPALEPPWFQNKASGAGNSSASSGNGMSMETNGVQINPTRICYAMHDIIDKKLYSFAVNY